MVCFKIDADVAIQWTKLCRQRNSIMPLYIQPSVICIDMHSCEIKLINEVLVVLTLSEITSKSIFKVLVTHQVMHNLHCSLFCDDIGVLWPALRKLSHSSNPFDLVSENTPHWKNCMPNFVSCSTLNLWKYGWPKQITTIGTIPKLYNGELCINAMRTKKIIFVADCSNGCIRSQKFQWINWQWKQRIFALMALTQIDICSAAHDNSELRINTMRVKKLCFHCQLIHWSCYDLIQPSWLSTSPSQTQNHILWSTDFTCGSMCWCWNSTTTCVYMNLQMPSNSTI